MKTTWKPILALVFVLALVSACAHKAPEVKTAKDLYQEAAELSKKGNVDRAAEKFMEVRTYYPGDELAKKALLSTADLYYNHELYESGLQSYEEFRLLYPTDEESAYCLYRIGLCHFNQMSTFDRDQSKTVKAVQAFDTFLSSYPNSPYVQGAKDNLLAAKTVLAKHYVYIGKFYLKKNIYTGACRRFQYVKQHYADVPLEDDINELISRSCTKSEEGKKQEKKP